MLSKHELRTIEVSYSLKVASICMLEVKSWNALYRLATDEGEFCLKVLNKKRNWDVDIVPDEDLRFIYDVSKLFDSSDLYKVSLPIFTQSGTCWTQSSDNFFLLFKWINNAQPLALHIRGNIELGGRILSELHKKSYDFNIESPSPKSIIQWDIIKWIKNAEAIISNVGIRSKQLLSRHEAILITDWFNRECRVIHDSKPTLDALLLEGRRGIIHGGFTPGNILTSDAGLYLIDFDACQNNFYVFDLAYALLEFSGGQYLYGGFDVQKARVFVRSYVSERPLSRIEIDTLPIFLKFVILRAVSYAYKSEQFIKRHGAYKELDKFNNEVLKCFV